LRTAVIMRDNGKAGRFIKTLLEDWAYAVPCRSSSSGHRQLPIWFTHYNHERPHAASLAFHPPLDSRLT
jgi:hypothetical protein